MADSLQPKQQASKVDQRRNVRGELDELEGLLADLKLKFEQYFLGIIQLAPDAQHQDVRRMMRNIRKAPFKNAAMSYRLKTLESRYQTFNTYWQRVMREREEGTYSRDVFKAQIREKQVQEEHRARTSVGIAEKGVQALFDAYKTALKQQTGSIPSGLEYDKFKESVVRSAKSFSETHQGTAVTFKVLNKAGRIVVQAVPKSHK